MFATRALTLVLAVAMTGCVINPAPRGVLPREEHIETTGNGAWIHVATNNKTVVEGELLAATDDTVWIYSMQSALQTVPREMIRDAKVGLFAARVGGLDLWMMLGTLSTFSNGMFLIFTAPMWLVGGGFSLSRIYRQPVYELRQGEALSSFAQFARFPGGIPETVDRSTLRSQLVIQIK